MVIGCDPLSKIKNHENFIRMGFSIKLPLCSTIGDSSQSNRNITITKLIKHGRKSQTDKRFSTENGSKETPLREYKNTGIIFVIS